MKNILKMCDDPYLALLAYRSTPLEVSYSLSELLMCRKLRMTVPATSKLRQPECQKYQTLSRLWLRMIGLMRGINMTGSDTDPSWQSMSLAMKSNFQMIS